jgi:hypothetical protein
VRVREIFLPVVIFGNLGHLAPNHGQGEKGMTNNATRDRIMQLAMGFWASKTLLSAVEIGVFGALTMGRSTCTGSAPGSACMSVLHGISSMR